MPPITTTLGPISAYGRRRMLRRREPENEPEADSMSAAIAVAIEPAPFAVFVS